jgi:carbonic anhydrase/acetyltransferase-like protein (isoleucine patch superfamily)
MKGNFTRSFLSKKPKFTDRKSNFIANSAELIGAVSIGKQVSIYPKTVLRADINEIKIGNRTNIQDATVGHVSSKFPLIIGESCTVGHGAMLHACTIGDRVLVGMRAILLDGCVIGSDSIIAAGSLVPKGKVFKERSLIVGVPAKVVRNVTDQEVEEMKLAVEKYISVSNDHSVLEAGKE